MSHRSLSFVAVLTATTVLAGASAYAADQAKAVDASPPPGHSAVVKDFGKLSTDSVKGYQDVTLARLAIYDGRTADAKTFVSDAVKRFDQAKSDESVFTAAESAIRAQTPPAGKTAAAPASDTKDAAAAKTSASDAPIAWLPVYGSVSIDEDYSMQPARTKAVADANSSLAKGDRKGAMDKLKLADIDTSVTMAVVPLKQTVADVTDAKQLLDSGKFYEGSQKLRAIQNSTVLTIADIPSAPAKASQSGSAPSASPGKARLPHTDERSRTASRSRQTSGGGVMPNSYC